MSTKSPSSSSRNVRTKDKLKHSRNETRRRARIRDQFDHLKSVIQCEKKDRFNILQSAVEVVQALQLRIAELETVIHKYEAHTKVRFPVTPLSITTNNISFTSQVQQPASKRSRLERAASKRASIDDEEEVDEEEEEEEEEEDDDEGDVPVAKGKVQQSPQSDDEDAEVDEEEGAGASEEEEAAMDAAVNHVETTKDVTMSIGSTLSSSMIAAPKSAVTTGTSSQAVNVLATLASVASASTSSTSSAPASKGPRKPTPPSSTVGRKRKIDVKPDVVAAGVTSSTTASSSITAAYVPIQMATPVTSSTAPSLPYATTTNNNVRPATIPPSTAVATHFQPMYPMYSHSPPTNMRMGIQPMYMPNMGPTYYPHPMGNAGAPFTMQPMPMPMMQEYNGQSTGQSPMSQSNPASGIASQPNFFPYNNTVTAAS